MNARQRKVLLFIEARQSQGLIPSVNEISEGIACTNMLVYDYVYGMRDLGMVTLQRVRRGPSFVTEVSLTAKAKALVPRVKELVA